jgi:hypothetical protein
MSSASGSISGTATAGARSISIEGSFAFDDRDSRTIVVVGTGKDATTVAQVVLDGRTYTRTRNGPWLEQEPGRSPGGSQTSSARSGVASLLDRLDELKPDGEVVRGGRTLTRLVVPATAIDPETLGFLPDGVRSSDLELGFYAKKDGTLAGITISVRWSQLDAAGTTPMSMDLEFLVTSMPSQDEIQRPEDVWVVVAPPGASYSFAIPEGWDLTPTSTGLRLDGPGLDSIFIYSMPVDPSASLKLWALESIELIEHEGGRVTANLTSSVGGAPAQVIFYDIAYDGVEMLGIDAAFLAAGRGYDVIFESNASDAASQREFFEQFLASFDVRGETGPTAPSQPQPDASEA